MTGYVENLDLQEGPKEYSRTASLGIGVGIDSSRLIEVTRDVAQGLGFVLDGDLLPPSPYEDFTTYDESDTPNRYSFEGLHKLIITGLARTDDNLYIADSKGVGHFGDFEHLVEVYMDAVTDASTSYFVGTVWGVANEENDVVYFTNKDAIFLIIRATVDNGKYAIALQETYSGSSVVDTSIQINEDVIYYLKIKRVGTTVTCDIYLSDANREAEESAVDNLQILDCIETTFEYIYASSSYHYSIVRTMTGYVENLDLQEEAEEYSRNALQAVGIGMMASRLPEYLRTASQTIGIGFDTTRLSEFVRSAVQSISIIMEAGRLATFVRTTSQSIGVGFTTDRLREVYRTAAQAIGIALESSRLSEFVRSTSQAVGVGLATDRLREVIRTATQSIGVGLATDRLVEITRGVTQGIGIALNGERLIELYRIAAQSIGMALDSSRLAELYRAATQSIGIGLTTERLIEVVRTATQSIGVGFTTDRLRAVYRTASQTINTGFASGRLAMFVRSAS